MICYNGCCRQTWKGTEATLEANEHADICSVVINSKGITLWYLLLSNWSVSTKNLSYSYIILLLVK